MRPWSVALRMPATAKRLARLVYQWNYRDKRNRHHRVAGIPRPTERLVWVSADGYLITRRALATFFLLRLQPHGPRSLSRIWEDAPASSEARDGRAGARVRDLYAALLADTLVGLRCCECGRPGARWSPPSRRAAVTGGYFRHRGGARASRRTTEHPLAFCSEWCRAKPRRRTEATWRAHERETAALREGRRTLVAIRRLLKEGATAHGQ